MASFDGGGKQHNMTLREKKLAALGEVKIIKKQMVTHDLMLMWLEKPEGYAYKPGQYCTIGREGIERAYSMASAPHESFIELFVEIVPPPEGQLTPKLAKLNVGDALTIRPRAKGIFVFKPELPKQFLVATVTGVVPYVAFLRDYIHTNKTGHHFYVLMGASYMNEFTYKDEREKIANARPDLLTFVPTVSRPKEAVNASWKGETGRVNAIAERLAAQWGMTPSDTIVYACGHPGMIESIKEQFEPKGYKFEEERFWKEDD